MGPRARWHMCHATPGPWHMCDAAYGPLPSGVFGTKRETKHFADRRAERKGIEYV